MDAIPTQRATDDRRHLDRLRAPDSDVAVPSNPAALESVAQLLAQAFSAR